MRQILAASKPHLEVIVSRTKDDIQRIVVNITVSNPLPNIEGCAYSLAMGCGKIFNAQKFLHRIQKPWGG